MSRGQGLDAFPALGWGWFVFPRAPPAPPHTMKCVLASGALAGGRGVLESGQEAWAAHPRLQVHHSIQVIRDGVPGIGDELGGSQDPFSSSPHCICKENGHGEPVGPPSRPALLRSVTGGSG